MYAVEDNVCTNNSSHQRARYAKAARIRGTAFKAEAELQVQVNDFLQAMKATKGSTPVRDLDSDELLPFFQAYAEAVVKAEMTEMRSQEYDLLELISRLRRAVLTTVNRVCQPDGVWERIVVRVIEGFDPGFWKTEFGCISRASLIRPRPRQLRARLQAFELWWYGEFWEKKTAELEGGAAETRVQAHVRPNAPQQNHEVPFPKRASWFVEELSKRHWNQSMLVMRSKLSRKTVAKCLKGKMVTASTLSSIADGLSLHPKYKTQVEDIPDT